MTNVENVSRRFNAVIRRARWFSRRKIYLSVIGFHLLVATAIGFGAVGMGWGNVWEAFVIYREALDRKVRAREARNELREIGLRVSALQRDDEARGQLRGARAAAHSVVQQSAQRSGLQLKGFVASEEDRTHLVTFEGAFVNVVMLVRALPQELLLFRVRRFISRRIQSREDRIELEILIENAPIEPELSPVCITLSQ